MKKILAALAVASISGLAVPAWAHSDMHVSVLGGVIDVAGDELLIDGLTGYRMFEGDFGDLEGGPFKTDDPGFLADPGNFAPGVILGYRAQGTLQYWDGSSWGSVAGQERVQMADAFEEVSIFAASGTSGKLIGLIDQVGGDGVLHAHLDYSIENSGGVGDPAMGAYAIQLSLLALDQDFNPLASYGESQPFFLIFNRGLSAQAFENALDARITAVPVPASGPLLGAALAAAFAAIRRRSGQFAG